MPHPTAQLHAKFISPRCWLTIAAIGGFAVLVQAQDNPFGAAPPTPAPAPATSTATANQAQNNPFGPATPAAPPAPATSPATATSAAPTASDSTAAAPAARRGAGSARGNRPPPPPPVAKIPRDSEPFTSIDFSKVNPELVTLVIAGDSTAQTGSNSQRGWAALLVDYFDQSKINLVNPSVGARSFRNFTFEGRWDKIVANLKKGDYVFIQFGHNDGTGNNPKDPLYRQELGGLGEETLDVTRTDGTVETVHTFGWYARKYIKEAQDKGANPVMMTSTVYNRWNPDGSFARAGSNVALARQVAELQKVPLLDDTNIISDKYDQLGRAVVEPLFGDRILHTDTAGAIVNAEAFVAGIKYLNIKPLVDALNDKGKAIPAYKPAEAKPADATPAPTTSSIPAAPTPAAASSSAK